MKISMNQHLVKLSNKSLVLTIIKEQAPLSRAEISQRSGLNKGTVSSLVQELLEEQLCFESGPGESSGGRRPVMLLFNQQAGYSIGIDLGVNYILGLLTDLQGNIVHEKKVSNPSTRPHSILKAINTLIRELLDNAPSSHYGVVGIGIGVPGVVDNKGTVLLAPNLGWKNVHLKEGVEETFQLPVLIENEAKAGAYGESQFGSGQLSENLIYVSAGTGIGIGIILKGELYRGVNGFSGEMGHMTIDINGPTCRCGNRGCWELYSSEQALLLKAQAILPTTVKDNITLELLLKEAKSNHQEVIELFHEIGTLLGVGINTIVNTFNPHRVIIGNRLAEAKEWLREPIEQLIAQNYFQFQRENLEISFSTLTVHATALGMAAFSNEQFLKADYQEIES
ncbi:ROK family transcriptional regulator [Bacillus solitudinis]|uniref:ROK family transcriptional regulator n=1 Tax=Bacillus solitudinis TaxID=2014074 RepID=UPI000C24D4EE|nr:ROK family transcriptional regulator [Bacillus solitudinis]